MSTNELAAKLKALSREQRDVVEALIELLAEGTAPPKQPALTGHSSFGAWSGRKDLPADSDTAARDLRKRAGRRESA
jgi:hypothetical protein